MNRIIALVFFALLAGSAGCFSKDTCDQAGAGMMAGCGGSSSTSNTTPCGSTALNCAVGTHQSGNSCIAN